MRANLDDYLEHRWSGSAILISMLPSVMVESLLLAQATPDLADDGTRGSRAEPIEAATLPLAIDALASASSSTTATAEDPTDKSAQVVGGSGVDNLRPEGSSLLASPRLTQPGGGPTTGSDGIGGGIGVAGTSAGTGGDVGPNAGTLSSGADMPLGSSRSATRGGGPSNGSGSVAAAGTRGPATAIAEPRGAAVGSQAAPDLGTGRLAPDPTSGSPLDERRAGTQYRLSGREGPADGANGAVPGFVRAGARESGSAGFAGVDDHTGATNQPDRGSDPGSKATSPIGSASGLGTIGASGADGSTLPAPSFYHSSESATDTMSGRAAESGAGPDSQGIGSTWASGSASAGSLLGHPAGGGSGGLIARSLRQRDGVPYDDPGAASAGHGSGGDAAFETLDAMIARYVDHALATLANRNTSGDFTVDVSGSDALGTFDFDATVTYDYAETSVNNVFSADNTDSFSYTFSEHGSYADGTSFTLLHQGSLSSTLTGSGTPGSRTLTTTLTGSDSYTLDEERTYSGGTLAAGSYSVSSRHSGTDQYSLGEDRTESYSGSAISGGRNDFVWTESNTDVHTFDLDGTEAATALVGGSMLTRVFTSEETRSDTHSLHLDSGETLGSDGRPTGGDLTYTWDENGSGDLTQSESGTQTVTETAGGGTQYATYTSTLTHTDSSSFNRTGTDAFTAVNSEGSYTWDADGAGNYSSSESTQETSTYSSSETATESSGGRSRVVDVAATLTLTSTGSGDDSHSLHQVGSESMDSGTLTGGNSTATWTSDGHDDFSLHLTGGRAATDSSVQSWSYAHGSTSLSAVSDDDVSFTHRTSGDDAYHSLALTATETLGQHGVVTGGTTSASAHQDGTTTMTLEEAGVATTSQSSGSTFAAGGLTSNAGATLSRSGTYSSLETADTTLTLDQSATAVLGVGGALAGGSSTRTLAEGGDGGSSYGETGNETGGSSATATSSVGGQWSVSSSSDDRTADYVASSSGTSTDRTSNLTATESFGAGGVVTAGFAASALHEVGIGSSSYSETGNETGSGSVTLTYQEGGLVQSGSGWSSATGSFESEVNRGSTATLDSTGSETSGVGGILLSGGSTATYQESHLADSYSFGQSGTLSSGNSSSETYLQGGASFSSNASDDLTQDYSSSASGTGGHSLSRTATLTLGAGGVVTGGSAAASYHEYGSADTQSTSETDTASSGGSFSQSIVEGGLTASANGGYSSSATLTATSSALGGHTLDRTMVESYGTGGVISSGARTDTYREHGDADSYSLYQTGGQTGNSSSNATYRFGESSMSGTSSGDTTSNDFTMSLTGSGTHSTRQVSSLSVGSGGTITAGDTTATLHAAGTSALAGSENAFGQTGSSSSNASFQEGGTTLTGGSSSNVTASHGSTFGSNSTLSQDQTLHQSLGLEGTILGGDAYSTAHEDGADSFSLGETVTATTSLSSNHSSNYHEAFSAAGTTQSATLTTGFTSTGSGLHAVDQSTTLALGAGGTITQGLGGTTWSGSGGGLTSSTETGTETGNASSTISFATGPDSDTASTTLQTEGGHNGGSTLGITWSNSGDSAVTLGTNGAITAGSRTATLHERSTQSTSSLIATGSSTSGSSSTRSRFRIDSAPATDDTSTSATNDYTQTASDSGGYTVNQSLVQDYGPAGTIGGGTATTSYAETSTHDEGLIESGSETSTIHTNYGVSTTKQDELVTSGSADRGESTTFAQSSTVTWGASGTIASGQSRYTLDRSGDGYRSGDGEGTREETNSSFAKDGDLDTTSSGTDTYSLHEVGTVTLGTNADIAGGDRDITWSQSASETHSLGFDDSDATFADDLGGPSFTGSASNDESGRSSVSTAETGHHSLGAGGSITSGDTSYTWDEGRYASHALGINCSPTLVVAESGDNTFSLHETGTETLGAGGTITSGSDTFTWDQSGNNHYHLHSRSESAAKTYTLDIVDPVNSSWHDTGTESFGEGGELEAATDHYTWDQGRSVTMTLSEDGTVYGSQIYDLEAHGTDAISMHNVGHSTFSNNEITNSDNYTWSESSSNAATFGVTDNWSGGGLTRGVQGGDSYSVTVEGMEADPNSSSLSFTLDQAHHVAVSANGQASNTTFSYSFDVIDDDREYSIHATGSEIGEPGLARRSLSFTNAIQEDYSQATTLSYDDGSLEYTMDQELSAHHSATRDAHSTLSGTWSSFDSHQIYENETQESASGYVVDDPQAGQVSYDYESNGTDSIDYHNYGGGTDYSLDIDDSFFDGGSTGGIPSAVTDQYDTSITFQSEAHSTAGYTYSTALFGVPETDIDTVHLGTSMNLGGSGNLHDLIGSVTTRNLARDAMGLAAGADEIHPILELQNPYHFVLVDSMEGNGTWDTSPGAWQYRRNWEVSQEEMFGSSASRGARTAFQSLGEEDGYGTPSNSPNAPGGRETGMASEASQAFNRFLQTDDGRPSTSSNAKPGRPEQLVLDPARTTPTCMACHAGLTAGLIAYEDLTPGAQFAIARWGAPKKNFMGRFGAFLDGVIAGVFSEDDSWSTFAGQAVGGINPVADVRDVGAGFYNVRQGKAGAGFGLFVAAVGVFPVVGDIGEAGLRGLGKLGSEGIERAARETLQDSTRRIDPSRQLPGPEPVNQLALPAPADAPISQNILDSPYNPHSVRQSLEQRYPGQVTSTTVPPVNPRNNVDLAGQVHSNGIVFDSRGFPIFDDVAVADLRVTATDVAGANYQGQMRAATRILRDQIHRGEVSASGFTANQIRAIQAGLARIPDYTWHHHQNIGRMQLVPRATHREVGHIGGFQMWYGR